MLLSFLMIVGMETGIAQSLKIHGTVTEKATGTPLPGVAIQLKGTSVGTVTDVSGVYSMMVDRGQVLVFSFIGMKAQEMTVKDNTTLNVSLEAENKALDEVVVVGYGVQRKEALTGAMTNVGAERLAAVTVTSIDKALQGNSAGVIATSASGTPGSFATIQVRGSGSVNAGTEPLYVIDGIPVMSGSTSGWATSSNALASLNPADIQSMTILKDAAATAIYGSRASNGVVLITTKKGAEGKTKITVTLERGFAVPTNTNFSLCNSKELLMLQREAVDNAREYFNNLSYDWTDPNGEYYLPDELANTDTDWWDVITRKGLYQSYDVSAAGGNEKTKFFGSVSYMKQEGIIMGTDFARFSARLNLDHQISKRFSFNISLSASNAAQNYALDKWAYENPVVAAYTILPYDSPYNEDGTPREKFTRNANGNYNPIINMKENHRGQKTKSLVATSYLQYQIIPSLTFRTTFGMDYKNTRERTAYGEKSNVGKEDNCPIYVQDWRYYSWTSSNTLTFNRVFQDRHSLDILLGYEAMAYKSDNLYAAGAGANDDVPFLKAASADLEVSEGVSENSAISMFGRMNYSFDSRYYLAASFRRDGSSRFGDDSKWANFWSVSGAWKLSGESFMQADFLDLLKLRVSYGTTGNSSINNYASKGLYSPTKYGSQGGSRPSQLANPAISWESAATTNLAIDFGFLNRINGSVEYFWRKTTDLLLSEKLSYTTGFTSILRNTGSIMNRGLEFQISADIFGERAFQWTSDLNITFPSSKVLNLGGEEERYEGAYQKRRVNGKSFTEWYMADYAGVNPADGMPLWYDEAGGLTSDYAKARYAYMGTPEPDFYGGFTNTFSWKGISFSCMFYFTYGNTVLFHDYYYLENDGATGLNANLSRRQLKRWQKPGDITEVPKPILSNPTKANDWACSRWLEDGSYIRLKNLTLAYDFPKQLLGKIGINNLRVYCKGTNLWTKSNVWSLDPEVGVYGVNRGNVYPNSRSVVFGINIGL